MFAGFRSGVARSLWSFGLRFSRASVRARPIPGQSLWCRLSLPPLSLRSFAWLSLGAPAHTPTRPTRTGLKGIAPYYALLEKKGAGSLPPARSPLAYGLERESA